MRRGGECDQFGERTNKKLNEKHKEEINEGTHLNLH